MSKTAIRRHHAERVLNRRKRSGHWAAQQKFVGWQNMLSRTPCRCSCFMCRSTAQQRAEVKDLRASQA